MNALQDRKIDNLLREFYRAEMPAPWPVLEPPADVLPFAQPRPRKTWWRRAGRLALAASVAFLLIGYLALASMFPPETSRGLKLQGPEVGHNPLGPAKKADMLKRHSAQVPQNQGLKLPSGFRQISEDRVPGDPKGTIIFSGRE